MVDRWLRRICACLSLLLAAGLLAPAADARPIDDIRREGVLRVGVNPNFPPMSSYGDDGQLRGFDVDIARALARRLGVRLQLVPTEAAQRVPFLISGRIDLSLGALTITPERQALIDFTIPVHSEAMGVITTDRVAAESWQDLDRADITLVNMRGNQSVELLREKLPAPQRLLVDGNADTIRAIAQGRADALVENVDFFIGFTRNYPDIGWRVLSDPIFSSLCAVGVEKGNDTLRREVNRQLHAMHVEGEIAGLWQRWYAAEMTVPVPAAEIAAGADGGAAGEGGASGYRFAFGQTFERLPYLLGGALVTLQIAFSAFSIGAVIGLFGALGKQYGGPALRRAIGFYVTFVTNTPALVQIFLLYYALPDMGIMLGSLTAVIIGLALNSGAYLTEIIRSGVASVRRAELDAAIVLGLKPVQILWHVMLPHIMRTIFRPLSNFFVWLVLGSSMAALFGVEELTGRAINISSVNLRTIETFMVVGAIYVVLTLVASGALTLLGRHAFGVGRKAG
ncbi:ABC transporter substrate-binding protein/permease [Sphingomonas baiyangensis]|nr:ABC transporter substrate-binding protein/permease [Sphingomonas baiyangensis]